MVGGRNFISFWKISTLFDLSSFEFIFGYRIYTSLFAEKI